MHKAELLENWELARRQEPLAKISPLEYAAMLKDIVEARATGDHRLYIRFEDGVSGEIDLGKLIDFRGVFEPLRRPEERCHRSILGELLREHGTEVVCKGDVPLG